MRGIKREGRTRYGKHVPYFSMNCTLDNALIVGMTGAPRCRVELWFLAPETLLKNWVSDIIT